MSIIVSRLLPRMHVRSAMRLPAYQADRGGLRFVSPPDLGVVSLQASASGLGSATSIWTEATDANPAGATKPVYQVLCGSEQLVYVNADAYETSVRQHAEQIRPEQIARTPTWRWRSRQERQSLSF